MEVVLARTQGFCAGVARAVKIVEQALEKYGTPLYVYHEIVHNTHVIDDFKRCGVVFVDRIEDVPAGEHVIFSAHGVSPLIMDQAAARGLQCIDATCPLVKRIHTQAIRFSQEGVRVVLIGHKGHQELIGTAGYVNPELLYHVETEEDVRRIPLLPEGQKIASLTQTTLSLDDTARLIAALRDRFPGLIEPDRSNICYATQRRQEAVRELSRMVELIIVCGSESSSNSKRLRETGEKSGRPSILIDNADQLDMSLLNGKQRIGVSSGASVPQKVVDDLVAKILKRFPGSEIRSLQSMETKVIFPIPQI